MLVQRDLSSDIQDHFENNRYYYEEYAQESSSKNGTLTYSFEKHSLVLTATMSVAVKDVQFDTYRKIIQSSIDDSHSEYNEILDKLQSDVPEAAFVVRFVDQNRKLIAEKKYK